MRPASLLSVVPVLTGVLATGHIGDAIHDIMERAHFFTWWKPGPTDDRSPCPLLNSLANHGFIPHDGRNIDEKIIIESFKDALNVDQDMAKFFFSAGLSTNPDPKAMTFSLGTLSRHNIIEHDGSLSRRDFAQGNDYSFHQATFDETKSHWTEPTINIQMAANARAARIATAKANNPSFGLSADLLHSTFIESANYMLVFGDATEGTVPRSWVEYLFEKEKLPLALGWLPRQKPATLDALNDLAARIQNATKCENSES